MKTRTRSRGVDGLLAYRSIVPPQFNSNAYTVTINFSPNSRVYPEIISKRGMIIPMIGVELKAHEIPDPSFIKNSSGYYYADIDEGYLSSLASIVESRVSERIWESYNGGIHKFLEVDTFQTMTDVIGSGFVSAQGKNFIVNPCTSEKREFNFATSTSKGWTKSVTCAKSNASTSSVSFRFTISLVPSGFTVGLPLVLAQRIKSDAQSMKVSDGNSTFQTAYSRVQEGEAEALTMLAESNKTFSYIANRLRNMGEILVKAKRAVTKLDTKAAADLWLEARYAIRPIIYDVEGVVNAINKDSLSVVQTFRASDTEHSSSTETYTAAIDNTAYKVDVDYQLLERHNAGVYTRLRLDMPKIHTFGLTNFAQTAWELVPFSFIIDWFVNISGFLASVNPSPIYRIENGYLASKRTVLANCTLTVTRGGESETRHFVYQINTYSRDKKLIPSFFNLDLNLSVPKVVDLFALAKKLL